MNIEMLSVVSDAVYAMATNGDLSPDKRRRAVLRLLDEVVQEVAIAEYHKGRADGAIEACRGLGGFDDSINELAVAMQKDADG
jgi:hypothetical protein